MKNFRVVLALALLPLAAAACERTPTEGALRPGAERRDGAPPPPTTVTDTTNRGGGVHGSGN